ncbi:MAG: hypothetical protein IT448_04605 [Phycisphaerales bacterium]|nr:hypothetical protein [Phycisphaerales bacterium]
MLKRIVTRAVAGFCVTLISGSSLLGQAVAPAGDANNFPADQALAARISGYAQLMLHQQANLTKPVFDQAAVLYATAAKLNPREVRYWGLLAEAEIEAGNNAGAIDALRSLENVDPRDTIPAVWVRMIDLYLQQLQQTPEKLNYLEKIYNEQSVPASVRSHAAQRMAELRYDQAAPGLARQWVDKALELNHVNPQAARLLWTLLADSDDQSEKIKALQTLVQADPANVANVTALAQQLALSGFYDAAITWYAQAVGMGQVAGASDPQTIFDYAAELYIANNALSASSLVTQLLQSDAHDVDALFLRLLLDRDKPAELRSKTIDSARQALLDELTEVRKNAGIAIGSDAYDLTADRQLLQGDQASADLKASYAVAVADQLWFELYFTGPSDVTDRLLDFLRAVAPAESATLARLEGWNYLLRGQKDQAKVKLQAAADRDPLAALGLLRMADHSTDQALHDLTLNGQALLSDHPAGLIGAFLASELRQYGVRVQPHQSVVARTDEVRAFARDWPQIYTNPSTFYTVRIRPLKVSHQIGQPILARVEIQNNSSLYALSIDPMGAIHPDLWFDVRIQGAIQENMSGVAFDRLMQAVVLEPKQTLSQIVRLDRGALATLLDNNPQLAFPMSFTLILNPQTVKTQDDKAVVVPGLLGQAVPFIRIINREPSQPTNATVKTLIDDLQAGLPEKKIETIDLIDAWVPSLQRLAADANIPDDQKQQVRPLVNQLLFQLSRSRQDTIPAVRAWASYTSALLTAKDNQSEVLRQMRSGNSPVEMILSVMAAQQISPEVALEVAERLSFATDPMVQRLTTAVQEAAKIATTQPTTAPSPDTNK